MDLRKTCPVALNPSIVPTDVTFVIEYCGTEVKAHKFILAMASPVFMKQIFVPLKEIRHTIPVKETTKESFATMIDFLYGKEVDWKAMSVEKMFDIANMAEKYDIDALMEVVKRAFEDYPLDETNVVVCASLAREYGQFEEVADLLLLQCAKFLKTVLVKAKDFEAFAAKYCDTDLSETAFKLVGIMSTIPHASCCNLETCRRVKGIYRKVPFSQSMSEGILFHSHPWNNIPLSKPDGKCSSKCEHPSQCILRQPRPPPFPSITFLFNERSKYQQHMMEWSKERFAGCERCFSVDNENYGCDDCVWLKWWYKWHGETHGFPDLNTKTFQRYL